MRNWSEDLGKFEKFLAEIDIQKYSQLKRIKTVEQDLPKELLPLELFYHYYWNTTDFRDYDEIFEIYWSQKLNPHIYKFIKKFFYGCSLQFVEEGFKARLYRIWMSVLTQFHFQYLWNSLFVEKLVSYAELDAMGIDAILELGGIKVGIQIKKVSYRREASSRRFTKRQRKYVDVVVEVPYLVVNTTELEGKLKNPRVKEHTKAKYRSTLKVFNANFSKLDNGFVIFKEDYLKHIHDIVLEKINSLGEGAKITYDEILLW